MDTEEHFEYDTMEKLAELAENREKWNLEVNIDTIKYGSIGDVIALSSSDEHCRLGAPVGERALKGSTTHNFIYI